MLKILSILVVLAVGIFLLTQFYKPSALDLTQNEVVLKVGDREYKYPCSTIKKESKTFSNLDLEQYILAHGNERAILEKAKVDDGYEFNSNPNEIISKIFDTKTMVSIFGKNGLGAFELILKNGNRLNIFLLQQDSKKLTLFYGISDKTFSDIIEKLTGKKVDIKGGIVSEKPLTLWSEKVNGIDGVIGSIDH